MSEKEGLGINFLRHTLASINMEHLAHHHHMFSCPREAVQASQGCRFLVGKRSQVKARKDLLDDL